MSVCFRLSYKCNSSRGILDATSEVHWKCQNVGYLILEVSKRQFVWEYFKWNTIGEEIYTRQQILWKLQNKSTLAKLFKHNNPRFKGSRLWHRLGSWERNKVGNDNNKYNICFYEKIQTQKYKHKKQIQKIYEIQNTTWERNEVGNDNNKYNVYFYKMKQTPKKNDRRNSGGTLRQKVYFIDI